MGPLFFFSFLSVLSMAGDCLDDARRSVVQIENCRTVQRGSAVVIQCGSGRCLLTALHNVKGCQAEEKIVVDAGKQHASLAKLLSFDQPRDLAILSLDAKFDPTIPPLPFSTAPPDAEPRVVLLGYSRGTRSVHDKAVTLQHGGKRVRIADHFQLPGEVIRIPDPTTEVIAITGPIQPGDSGGPLLDSACRIRGIVIGGWMVRDGKNPLERSPGGEGYVIPVQTGDPLKSPAARIDQLAGVRTIQEAMSASSGSYEGIPIPALAGASGTPLIMTSSEITYGQFEVACGGDSPECGAPPKSKDRRLPITNLNGTQAQEVCRRLVPNGRLPSLKEWTVAAGLLRGKSVCAFNLDKLPCRPNPPKGIRPVTPESRDEYGFSDLFGNVFEIVTDRGKFKKVGGSYGTHIRNLLNFDPRTNLVTGIQVKPIRVDPGEVGFRCVYEER